MEMGCSGESSSSRKEGMPHVHGMLTTLFYDRYSYDQSLVHVVVLSTEHDMADGSPQHTWLEKDLAAVNRTVTPWIVVEMHRPLYRK